MSDEEEILPCVMCYQHKQQMLMLQCMHDPCINCASNHLFSGSYNEGYCCPKCGTQTQLDPSTVLELKKIYQQSKTKTQTFKERKKPISKKAYEHESYYDSKKDNPKVSSPKHYQDKSQTFSMYGHQPYIPMTQPSVSSNPTNNILAKKAQKQSYVCEEHPEQELSYFCFSCSVPICPQCAIHGSHRGHQVLTTRKAISQIRQNLNKCASDLQEEKDQVMSVRQIYHNHIKAIGEDNRRQKQNIKKQLKGLIILFGEKEKQFMKAIDAHSENNGKAMKGQIEQTDRVIDQYTNGRKNVEHTLKKDDLTILQEYSKRQKQSQQLIQTHSNKESKEPEGLNDAHYDVLRDQLDQLNGIVLALKLKSKIG